MGAHPDFQTDLRRGSRWKGCVPCRAGWSIILSPQIYCGAGWTGTELASEGLVWDKTSASEVTHATHVELMAFFLISLGAHDWMNLDDALGFRFENTGSALTLQGRNIRPWEESPPVDVDMLRAKKWTLARSLRYSLHVSTSTYSRTLAGAQMPLLNSTMPPSPPRP
jgi:hypothetical protein